MHFFTYKKQEIQLQVEKTYISFFLIVHISEKQKNTRQIIQLVLNRRGKMCNFLEWKNLKIIYKRYASLYFTFVVDSDDNELITLEIIHRYVTILGLFRFLQSQNMAGNSNFFLPFQIPILAQFVNWTLFTILKKHILFWMR